MVFKLKKRCIAFFSILILIQFSDVLSIHKKNKMEKYDLRKLQTTTTTPNTNPNSTVITPSSNVPNAVKKSSGGLSAGGIVAIVVPCIAALIAVGALAALCRSTPPPVVPTVGHNYMDTSLVRIKPPMQPVEVVQQPVAVVQQPVAVVQEVPVVQQPVAVVQEVPVVQQPVAVVQQPAAVVQEVPVVQEVVEPVTVVHETVV